MCLMILSTIVITVSLNLQQDYNWMAYISIACIITFIIGFALGLGKKLLLVFSSVFAGCIELQCFTALSLQTRNNGWN